MYNDKLVCKVVIGVFCRYFMEESLQQVIPKMLNLLK